MDLSIYLTLFTILWCQNGAQEIYETDMNFRVDPGSRTCFFERGEAGQVMEVKYQVIDGQHGDYDISFQVKDPNGGLLLNDHKQSHNSIIMDLAVSGDYVFCLDNTHSVMNSKLVFVYVIMENRQDETTVEDDDMGEIKADNATEEYLEWMGYYDNGESYYVPVAEIADSLTRVLQKMVRARQDLNLYGALKSRDTYLAYEDTFIVDMWSGVQICCMFLVGMIQVYMIKQLFNRTTTPEYRF